MGKPYLRQAAPGRVTGRRGVELRKRRLERDGYLCVECRKNGVSPIPIAVQVDHIVPLHMGGLDEDDNCQSLCGPCHDDKSRAEQFDKAVNLTHPDWLTPSAVPITIVCGPPASGKSTYCRTHAGAGDIVVDLDELAGGTHLVLTRQQLDGALQRRNKILGRLRHAKNCKAWFIVSAPTQAEREWWQGKLGGEVRVLDPGIEVCIARAKERGTSFQVPVIKAWYAPQEWWAKDLRKSVKKPIGIDGWPVES